MMPSDFEAVDELRKSVEARFDQLEASHNRRHEELVDTLVEGSKILAGATAEILNSLVAKPNKSDYANFATKDDLVHLEVRFDSIEIDVSDLKEILLNGHVNGDNAKARIQKVLDRVQTLHEKGGDSEEFRIWLRHTKNVLSTIFGFDSDHVKEFDSIDYVGWYPIVDSEEQNKRNATVAFQHGLGNASTLLRELIREIDEYA